MNQNLKGDVKASTSKQFDNIISSWSLAQVVNYASHTQEAEARAILRTVLSHLAPQGSLYLPGAWGIHSEALARELEREGYRVSPTRQVITRP